MTSESPKEKTPREGETDTDAERYTLGSQAREVLKQVEERSEERSKAQYQALSRIYALDVDVWEDLDTTFDLNQSDADIHQLSLATKFYEDTLFSVANQLRNEENKEKRPSAKHSSATKPQQGTRTAEGLSPMQRQEIREEMFKTAGQLSLAVMSVAALILTILLVIAEPVLAPFGFLLGLPPLYTLFRGSSRWSLVQ